MWRTVYCLIAVSVILLGVSPLHGAQTLFLHTGSNDPTTEGWVDTDVNGPRGVQAGPVVNDAGTGKDAWSLGFDTLADYRYYVASPNTVQQQQKNIVNAGWIFTTNFRIASISPNTHVDFWISLYMSGGGRTGPGFDSSYDLQFSCDSQGVLHPSFGSIDISKSPHLPFALPNPSDYHQYQIVFDPTTQTADLSLDGTTVLADVAPSGGGSPLIDWGMVYFGSGPPTVPTQLNVSLFQFDVVPEPASTTLAAIAAAVGIAFVCLKNKHSRALLPVPQAINRPGGDRQAEDARPTESGRNLRQRH